MTPIVTEPIATVQDTIVEEFAFFDDWTERYKYIIDLGRSLAPMDENVKTEENKVRGCQSQVWLFGKLWDGRVWFQADSDAMIVRGLAALILRFYSGRTPDEILGAEPEFIEKIGMSEHLSMTRANGLRAMVKQIKLYALAYKAKLTSEEQS
jgi:cysteine desulfuration protein SufE